MKHMFALGIMQHKESLLKTGKIWIHFEIQKYLIHRCETKIVVFPLQGETQQTLPWEIKYCEKRLKEVVWTEFKFKFRLSFCWIQESKVC